MKRLLQPSLFRRIIVAQVILFAFLAVILTAYAFWKLFAPDEGIFDTQRKALVNSVAQALADKRDHSEIRIVAQSLEQMLFRARLPQARVPTYIFIWDSGKKLIYARPGMENVQYIETQEGRARVMLNGNPYRVASTEQNGYIFQLADPIETQQRDIMLMQVKQLLSNLAISFPFALIFIWAAVYTGLRPLRKLGGTIEERHPDDLSPIRDRPPYREMMPLTNALDSLFARLRKKIALEKAFVHDAAHELQTPLAVISSQVHVLSSAESPDARDEAKRHAEQAIQRTSHLVRQLLDLARMDADTPSRKEMLNLAALARDVIAHLVPKAAEPGIEISLAAPDSLNVHADRNALYTILNNLVDNAVRYAGAGGRVAVELERRESYVSIHVLDDGPGISEADRERVFDRFYRVATRINDQRGSGLGLAIVKQAVTRMGGSIVIGEGLDGRGCGFTVEIPAPPRHLDS